MIFFLSFIPNSVSGGRGGYTIFLLFLVLLSHIFLSFHLGERAMKGLGNAKEIYYQESNISEKKRWGPDSLSRVEGTHGGQIRMS